MAKALLSQALVHKGVDVGFGFERYAQFFCFNKYSLFIDTIIIVVISIINDIIDNVSLVITDVSYTCFTILVKSGTIYPSKYHKGH
ncbi:MAG: hypothetical protein LBF63_08295, partial [Treponema sp.]|nr:hypothetical protein [Treponema sp.]